MDLAAVSQLALPESCGIYAIFCKPNGKLYLGSAAGKRGLRDRFRKHRSALILGKHHTPYLQAAFVKHGIQAFSFHVIELTCKDETVAREQMYLDKFKSYDRAVGFNTNPKAQSRLGAVHSEATRSKISAVLRALPSDVKARIKASKPPCTESAKLRYKELYSKDFALEKDGVVYSGKNVTQFCHEHGLDRAGLGRVLNGQWHSCKGWHRVGEAPEWERFKKERQELDDYRVTHPLRPKKHGRGLRPKVTQRRKPNSPFRLLFEGNIYEGTNVCAFARNHGLQPGRLNEVVLGNSNVHKGWTLPENPVPTYILIDPTGSEHVVCGVTKFAKAHQLHIQSVWQLCVGYSKQYKGWRLAPEINSEAKAQLTGRF
jgi:group I intron endonuclease